MSTSTDYTWSDLVAIEPELAVMADAIRRSHIPGTMPGYGRALLAVESRIDSLAAQHGRLTPEQADAAYAHAERLVRAKVGGGRRSPLRRALPRLAQRKEAP